MIVAVDGDLGGRLNPCATQRREEVQMVVFLPPSTPPIRPSANPYGEPYSPRRGRPCTVAQWRLLYNKRHF
jgi:hypothetical protein